MIYTIYRYKSFVVTEDKKKFWDDHYVFYEGERDWDKNDWRICEVPNKRKDISLIGMADINSFPVSYPLELTTGEIINKISPQIIFV